MEEVQQNADSVAPSTDPKEDSMTPKKDDTPKNENPSASRCPYENWGVRCTLKAGHEGDHKPAEGSFPSRP